MGYTTFKPFLGSWGVYDFPILALLGVTGASQSTLFCTRVIGPFGFLQCLVFSYSCRLMILHSFFLFSSSSASFWMLKDSFFIFLLIDIMYATKEVES